MDKVDYLVEIEAEQGTWYGHGQTVCARWIQCFTPFTAVYTEPGARPGLASVDHDGELTLGAWLDGGFLQAVKEKGYAFYKLSELYV